ncbi:MAG: hypothetical protein ACXVJ7_09790 [Acidimicrobiia bacterium]
MSMREDCRHYESRTYGSGEMVRKCRLDLAPEAPWRCPDDCPSYSRRMFDAGWQVGSMAQALGTPVESEPLGEDVAALLDAAEDIVNSAAPDIIAEFETPKRRFGARKRRKKKK